MNRYIRLSKESMNSPATNVMGFPLDALSHARLAANLIILLVVRALRPFNFYGNTIRATEPAFSDYLFS